MYRPILVTPPNATPVSLAEAKAQLRVDHGDDDTLLGALIDAAVAHVDGWTGILGRCLVSQTWRQDFDRLGRSLRLPLAPVISVASVKYDDTSGGEQTIDASNYTLQTDDLGPYLEFKTTYSAPSLYVERPAVRVAYVAGYESAAAVPAAIRHAILMMVAHWYEHREAVVTGLTSTPMPIAADALLAPFRRIRF